MFGVYGGLMGTAAGTVHSRRPHVKVKKMDFIYHDRIKRDPEMLALILLCHL